MFGQLKMLWIGSMRLALIIIINLLVLHHNSALADNDYELEEFAGQVFKGGVKYSLDDIKKFSEHANWDEHQKLIAEVQMLASVDDINRYHHAIDISNDYISNGQVEWAKNFLKLQQSFIFNLSGDREKGALGMEHLIAANAFNNIHTINDPLLEIIKQRHPDFSQYVYDIMRQSLGFYYLDFNKYGTNPEKAFLNFNGIHSEGLRNKCLEQLKIRLNNDKEYDSLKEKSLIHPAVESISQTEKTPRQDKRNSIRLSNAESRSNPNEFDRVAHVGKGWVLIGLGICILLFIVKRFAFRGL
jgi:hypothetical protein